MNEPAAADRLWSHPSYFRWGYEKRHMTRIEGGVSDIEDDDEASALY